MSDDIAAWEGHFPLREDGAIRLEEYMPHRTAELICLRCLHRYHGVWPESTPLAKLECLNCERIGFIITTGA